MDSKTAEILLSVAAGKSIKAAAYNSPYKKDKRLPSIVALTQKCVDNYDTLRSALIETGLVQEVQLPPALVAGTGPIRKRSKVPRTDAPALSLLVNLCEYLTNRRCPQSLKTKFAEHIETLAPFKAKMVLKQKTSTEPNGTTNETKSDPIPRYLRIDLSRISRTDAALQLEQTLGDITIHEDPVLNDVLSIQNSNKLAAKLLALPNVKNGSIVMMDRGTCFAAAALNLSPGDIVLDVCAAPGSKTLAFLSALGETGAVVCVERDEERFHALIKRITKESLLTNVELVSLTASKKRRTPVSVLDFKSWKELLKKSVVLFTSDERPGVVAAAILDDFFSLNACGAQSCDCDASHCLTRMVALLRSLVPRGEKSAIKLSLDPSCSGSGLPADSAVTAEAKSVAVRLNSLQSFQVMLLQFALGLKLPLQIVTYSTCSVYPEENQEVVSKALEGYGLDWKVEQSYPDAWKSEMVIEDEKEEYPTSRPPWWNLCLQTVPSVHKCRGFFLAKLEPINQIHTP